MAKVETFEELVSWQRGRELTRVDETYISEKQFHEMKDLAVEASRAIAGMMGYLGRSELRGNKYRTRSPDRPLTLNFGLLDLGRWTQSN